MQYLRIMNQNCQISLIVPCRNEAGTIRLAIEKGARLPGVAELIIVEGDSSDGTPQIVEKALIDLHLTLNPVLLTQKNRGKWDAVRLGIENANFPIISIWDADLTVSPDEQERIHALFIERSRNNRFTLAMGNRMERREAGAMKFFNVLGNYFFAFLWTLTARQKIYDSLCGSKIFEKEILRTLPESIKKKDPYGDFSIILGALLNEAKIITLPVTYRSRSYGQSNIARWRGGLQLLKVWLFQTYFILFQSKK